MSAIRRVIFAAVMIFAECAYGLELPEVVCEWRCVSEQVVPLVAEANGENLGRMVYRNYEREAPKGSVRVILTEGSGTGSLYVPEKVNASKGVMPSESEYRIVDIYGHKAILEAHGQLERALAVNAGQDVIVTVESSVIDEEGLAKFAENILRETR